MNQLDKARRVCMKALKASARTMDKYRRGLVSVEMYYNHVYRYERLRRLVVELARQKRRSQ
jgi:hypothetical protein